MLTDRLQLRLPTEDDRGTFVDLFCSDDFMLFSAGTMTPEAASDRFELMMATAREFPFAKQPVIERTSGRIVGYCGVAWFDFEGRRRLEFGYRFVPEARGVGYATEAGAAVLDLAATSFEGEVLAMIDPTNVASKRVAHKLGFQFWKMAEVDGYVDEIHRKQLLRSGSGGPT